MDKQAFFTSPFDSTSSWPQIFPPLSGTKWTKQAVTWMSKRKSLLFHFGWCVSKRIVKTKFIWNLPAVYGWRLTTTQMYPRLCQKNKKTRNYNHSMQHHRSLSMWTWALSEWEVGSRKTTEMVSYPVINTAPYKGVTAEGHTWKLISI